MAQRLEFYDQHAFGGIEIERLMHHTWEQEFLQDMDADAVPVWPSEYHGANVVDRYLDTEYYDLDRMQMVYFVSDTGSMFNVSEPFGCESEHATNEASRQLALEIRLSVLLNRLRCS